MDITLDLLMMLYFYANLEECHLDLLEELEDGYDLDCMPKRKDTHEYLLSQAGWAN